MRIETKSCSGIFARPTTGRFRSTGKSFMRVSFTTAPGRDDFHSKSCLYKSRLLLPVNVCIFIIVPTFDGAGYAGYQEIYAKVIVPMSCSANPNVRRWLPLLEQLVF